MRVSRVAGCPLNNDVLKAGILNDSMLKALQVEMKFSGV